METWEYCIISTWMEEHVEVLYRTPSGTKREFYSITTREERAKYEEWKKSLPRDWYSNKPADFVRDEIEPRLLAEGWELHSTGVTEMFRRIHKENQNDRR